ncbi:MAG: hypothetical protein OEU95_01950 [Nitrospirota bacterium]|nr:hypothetical protein [Nitrospirota bacterium]
MIKRSGTLSIIILFFCLIALSCERRDNVQAAKKELNQSNEPAEQAGASSGKKTATTRFSTISYIDRQGIGIEAFRMLIPVEWKFEGGINWVLDNPGMPATAGFRVYAPKGREGFEVFPNQSFFWTNNQMLFSMFPVGSRYFGNEVRPPVNPADAIKQIIIPRFRSNIKGLRVISERSLPDLPGAQSQPGVSVSAQGAKVRIEYELNGTEMEEEIYAVVESYMFRMQTMGGVVTNINWMVDYIFSFKTEKGKFEENLKTFQTIAHSFKLNPQWFNRYSQVVESLIQGQIRQIQSIGQLSRIISQTNNEISDMMMESYNNRQKVNDRIANDFSQYIRGVDEYRDPNEGKAVELPSGYDNAWSNSSGEYILSDDPNFNPNINSNLNWERMKKK